MQFATRAAPSDGPGNGTQVGANWSGALSFQRPDDQGRQTEGGSTLSPGDALRLDSQR